VVIYAGESVKRKESAVSVETDLISARSALTGGEEWKDYGPTYWIQGDQDNGAGGVCALGAVSLVCWGDAFVSDEDYGQYRAMIETLNEHLPPAWRDWEAPTRAVWTYNDDEETTYEDVVAWFDRAIDTAARVANPIASECDLAVSGD
jgi:hypothetical protein